MGDPASQPSTARIYWTAFIGLLFDYYDLYLFVYLEKVLAAYFALTPAASNTLQFTGLAGVGLGALGFQCPHRLAAQAVQFADGQQHIAGQEVPQLAQIERGAAQAPKLLSQAVGR